MDSPIQYKNESVTQCSCFRRRRAFCDEKRRFLFTPVFDFDQARETVSNIKQKSQSVDRDVKVLTFCTVVCRPTQKEADEYLDWYASENADWEAVDNLMSLLGHARSVIHEKAACNVSRSIRCRSWWFSVGGTPDTIADLLETLSATGIAGTTLSFVDYAKEFPYFRQEVLPRLEAKGLRHQPTEPVLG